MSILNNMNGPFAGTKSGESIAKFVKDELFVELDVIRKLAIKFSEYETNFVESFFQKNLIKLDNTYRGEYAKFLKLYNKWNTPDLLYEGLDIDSKNPQEFGPAMQDYFNSQQAVMWHFNEGFRLLENINNLLVQNKTSSYNRISVAISLFAIVISIILAIIIKR